MLIFEYTFIYFRFIKSYNFFIFTYIYLYSFYLLSCTKLKFFFSKLFYYISCDILRLFISIDSFKDSSNPFSSTFLDWVANLKVERVCEKFISAGLIVQIIKVLLLVVKDGASSLVNLESLYGICALIYNMVYFFLELVNLWMTLESINKLLLMNPVY